MFILPKASPARYDCPVINRYPTGRRCLPRWPAELRRSAISRLAPIAARRSTVSLRLVVRSYYREMMLRSPAAHSHGLHPPLDCGNSGTTMRLMSGILAGRQVGAALIGDESLSSRPMNRVIEPLEEMGAEISSNNGKAPLVVTPGRPLSGTRHELRIASAQIKSCLLLAGIGAEGTTEVIEPVPTRDHTERMLRWFGAEIDTSIPGAISIKGGQQCFQDDLSRCPDRYLRRHSLWSPRRVLRVRPCRASAYSSRTGTDVLRRTGVDLSITDERVECGEPVGDIVVRGSRQRLTAAAPLLAIRN